MFIYRKVIVKYLVPYCIYTQNLGYARLFSSHFASIREFINSWILIRIKMIRIRHTAKGSPSPLRLTLRGALPASIMSLQDIYWQCCGAGPTLTGSGSRSGDRLPAPGRKKMLHKFKEKNSVMKNKRRYGNCLKEYLPICSFNLCNNYYNLTKII